MGRRGKAMKIGNICIFLIMMVSRLSRGENEENFYYEYHTDEDFHPSVINLTLSGGSEEIHNLVNSLANASKLSGQEVQLLNLYLDSCEKNKLNCLSYHSSAKHWDSLQDSHADKVHLLSDNIAKLKTINKELEEKYSELILSHHTTKQVNANLTLHISVLMKSRKRLLMSFRRVSKRAKACKDSQEAKEKEIKNLQDERERLRQNLKAKEDNFGEKIKALQDDLKTCNKEKEQSKMEVKAGDKDKEMIKSLQDDLKTCNEEKAGDLSTNKKEDFQEIIKSLQDDLKNCNTEMEHSKITSEEQKEQEQQLIKIAELEKKVRELEEGSTNKDELETKLSDDQAKIAALEKEKQEQGEKIKEMSDRISALTSDLDEAQEKIGKGLTNYLSAQSDCDNMLTATLYSLKELEMDGNELARKVRDQAPAIRKRICNKDRTSERANPQGNSLPPRIYIGEDLVNAFTSFITNILEAKEVITRIINNRSDNEVDDLHVEDTRARNDKAKTQKIPENGKTANVLRYISNNSEESKTTEASEEVDDQTADILSSIVTGDIKIDPENDGTSDDTHRTIPGNPDKIKEEKTSQVDTQVDPSTSIEENDDKLNENSMTHSNDIPGNPDKIKKEKTSQVETQVDPSTSIEENDDKMNEKSMTHSNDIAKKASAAIANAIQLTQQMFKDGNRDLDICQTPVPALLEAVVLSNINISDAKHDDWQFASREQIIQAEFGPNTGLISQVMFQLFKSLMNQSSIRRQGAEGLKLAPTRSKRHAKSPPSSPEVLKVKVVNPVKIDRFTMQKLANLFKKNGTNFASKAKLDYPIYDYFHVLPKDVSEYRKAQRISK